MGFSFSYGEDVAIDQASLDLWARREADMAEAVRLMHKKAKQEKYAGHPQITCGMVHKGAAIIRSHCLDYWDAEEIAFEVLKVAFLSE